MDTSNKLITEYRFELVEDHHSSGSGRYGVRVILPVDISASFPFLNTVLDDTVYDHANSILIGFNNKRRYAFRPYEIQAGMIIDSSEAPPIADESVELVNRVWMERERIIPSLKERKLPAVYDIYKILLRPTVKAADTLPVLLTLPICVMEKYLWMDALYYQNLSMRKTENRLKPCSHLTNLKK